MVAGGLSATYDLGTRDFLENILEWTEREANTKISEQPLRVSHEINHIQRNYEDPTNFFLTENQD